MQEQERDRKIEVGIHPRTQTELSESSVFSHLLLSDVQVDFLGVSVVESLRVFGIVGGVVGGGSVNVGGAVVVVAVLHRGPIEHDGRLGLHARVLGVATAASALTPTDEETGQQHLELLLEVVVHPGVQERVVDGGAHGDDVGDEEDEGEVVPVLHGDLVLPHEQHDVERHPAAHEDDHHGDQHLVGPLLAPDLLLLAFAGPVAAADLYLGTQDQTRSTNSDIRVHPYTR